MSECPGLCGITAQAILVVQLICIGFYRVDEVTQGLFLHYRNSLEVLHQRLLQKKKTTIENVQSDWQFEKKN